MTPLNNIKNIKIVRLEDFICQRCHPEATNTDDHLCQLCKALGKGADKEVVEFDFWSFLFPTRAANENALSLANAKS